MLGGSSNIALVATHCLKCGSTDARFLLEGAKFVVDDVPRFARDDEQPSAIIGIKPHDGFDASNAQDDRFNGAHWKDSSFASDALRKRGNLAAIFDVVHENLVHPILHSKYMNLIDLHYFTAFCWM